MITILSLVEALLLVTASSTDAFVSGFAYGADKIKIPFRSAAMISLICSLILAFSLFLGSLAGPLFPRGIAVLFSFSLLLFLGIVKLFDSSIKAFIRKNNTINKKIKLNLFNLCFVLNIYADPETADLDRSKTLSPKEAAYLALALSLDGLAVGFGAGLFNFNPLFVLLLSLVSNLSAVLIGSVLGNKVAKHFSLDLSWCSGLLLIVLALMRVK